MNIEESKKKVKQNRQKVNNKRWTEAEVKKLLEYIQESDELEKPTAQIYYRKLLEATQIDATWNTVKWKVRHLKISYNKAESWRKSTGAGLLETDEGISSVKGKLKQMCYFYEELHNIFGKKSSEFPFKIYDTGAKNSFALNSTFKSQDISQSESNSFEEFDISEIIEIDDMPSSSSAATSFPTTEVTQESSLQTQSVSTNVSPANETFSTSQPPEKVLKNNCVQEFATKLKKSAPKNALDQLSIIQGERNNYLKEKLEFEKEKFKMEFQLSEKRFAEEVEDRKEKYMLKKLELEKQERIERLEIEMKYKYSSNT